LSEGRAPRRGRCFRPRPRHISHLKASLVCRDACERKAAQ
jgi:hypothetical protein